MELTEGLRQAIKEYKSGNAQAFDVLYHESSKYVYTCIYKVMSGNDNAQDATNDIMQDTYLEISRYVTQLEDEERFLSWAGTIATRKCYAYFQKSNKYVLLNEEDTTFDTLADDDNIIPETIMQDKEKQRLLREIIQNELTEMQKLCVIAYYYNEQKQSEIAKELGIPENTVKTNLSRAKAKIKEGVLDLEQKKGTKLYSVAPLMLLLFREDVLAAIVPQEITQGVITIVATSTLSAGVSTTAGAVGTTGAATGAATVAESGGTVAASVISTGVNSIAGKAIALSLKAKIIGGIAGLGVIGAVTGTVYMESKSDNVSLWDSAYVEDYFDGENETDEDSLEKEEDSKADKKEESVGRDEDTMSEEEMETFRILAQCFTATRWGDDLDGEEIVPTEQNVCDFIQNVANDNQEYNQWAYDKYLPERITEEVYRNVFTEESIKEYVKTVFDIRISEIDSLSFSEENGLYIALEGQQSSVDLCEITRVAETRGQYFVTGRYAFGEYEEVESTEPTYMEPYYFTMTLEKNSESPFGYTLIGIQYELAENYFDM